MIIRPRSEWVDEDQPVVGPAMRLNKIELFPAHYTSASTIPYDTAAYLRNIQYDYTVNRGYSIGYNFAIDQKGEAWEARGFDFRCAANVNMNDVTIACLCLVDGRQAMNDKMVATFQSLAAEAQYATGNSLLVVGHRDIGKTTCPGDGIYAQVQAGLLDPPDVSIPEPEPPLPPIPDDEEYLDMAAIQAIYKPGPNVSTQKNKWFVLRADGGVRHASGVDAQHASALKAPTYLIEGDEHYDILDRASGS